MVKGMDSAARFPGYESWIWSWANCSALWVSTPSFVKWEWYHHLHLTAPWAQLVHSKCSYNVNSCYWLKKKKSYYHKVMTSLYLDFKKKKKSRWWVYLIICLTASPSEDCTSWRLINFFLSQISHTFLAYKSSINVWVQKWRKGTEQNLAD